MASNENPLAIGSQAACERSPARAIAEGWPLSPLIDSGVYRTIHRLLCALRITVDHGASYPRSICPRGGHPIEIFYRLCDLFVEPGSV